VSKRRWKRLRIRRGACAVGSVWIMTPGQRALGLSIAVEEPPDAGTWLPVAGAGRALERPASDGCVQMRLLADFGAQVAGRASASPQDPPPSGRAGPS
jgi:hypothetical protein